MKKKKIDIDIIDEASKVERQYNTAMFKLTKSMVAIGYPLAEADYFVKLYTELRDKKLLESKYFSIKQEGKKVNIKNFGEFYKYPQFFYDVVSMFLNSYEFMEDYVITIDYNSNPVIEERVVEVVDDEEKVKPEQKGKEFKTFLDEYKVGEDENYVTYVLPNKAVANESIGFYRQVYSDQRYSEKYGISNRLMTKEYQSKFFFGWCITQKNSYFDSQKNLVTDWWLLTVTKHNPLDMLCDWLVDPKILDRLRGKWEEGNTEADREAAEETLRKEFFRADYATSMKYLNKMTELYLALSAGRHPSAPDRPSAVDHSVTTLYHPFSNNPGSGQKASLLSPELSYGYETLELPNFKSNKILVSGNELVSVNSEAKDVEIPEGVQVIKSGAFENSKIRSVALPFSLIAIEPGAFVNCPELNIISCTNNLRFISKRAFVGSTARPVVGVLFPADDDGGAYFAVRPKNLNIYPDTLSWDNYKSVERQYRVKLVDNTKLEVTDEDGNLILENVGDGPRVVSPFLYEEFRNFYIEHDKVIPIEYKYNPQDDYSVREDKIVIPEGVRSFYRSKFDEKLYLNVGELVFPSTMRDISGLNLHKSAMIGTINMFKSNVTTIPSRIFLGITKVEKIILPKALTVIQSMAFPMTLGTLVLPTDHLKSVDFAAFAGLLILREIVVDSKDRLKKVLGDQLDQLLTVTQDPEDREVINRKNQNLVKYIFNSSMPKLVEG